MNDSISADSVSGDPVFADLVSGDSRGSSRRFWVLLGVWMLVLLAPYIMASRVVPEGFAWSGLIYSPSDSNVHLAWMRQAAQGDFFVRDLFTTEWIDSGEKPLFWNGFFWILGRFCGLTGCPLVLAYHGSRVVFAALMLWRFDALCRLVAGRRAAFWACLLAAFSLGAGILAPLFPRTALIDRLDNAFFPFLPEAFTFSSALLFPLNVAAMWGLIVIWENVVRTYRNPGGWRVAAFKTALCGLWVGNVHTYDVVPLVMGLVAASGLIWLERIEIARKLAVSAVALGAMAGAFPPTIYQSFVWNNSTEFRLKALVPTAPLPVLDVVLSYSFLLLAALYAVWKLRPLKTRPLETRHMETRTLLCWMLPSLFAQYLPLSFGRKMMEGTHLPLCLLAALGAMLAVSRLNARGQRLGLALYCLVACSALPLFLGHLDERMRVNNANVTRLIVPPVHLSTGDWGALRYLESQPRGVVLSMPMVAGFVPQTTGHAVFCGIWAETLDFDAKVKQTLDFYSGRLPPAQLRSWLRKNHITWVLQGDYESRWFDAKKFPARALGLRVAWRGNGSTLYRVP